MLWNLFRKSLYVWKTHQNENLFEAKSLTFSNSKAIISTYNPAVHTTAAELKHNYFVKSLYDIMIGWQYLTVSRNN